MKFIFWGGIIFFIGPMFLLSSSYEDIRIAREGTIVKMQIMELPRSCLGTRVKHHATFFYQGLNFIKRIPEGYCNAHHVGEFVEMRYMEGEENILFPGESVYTDMIFNVLLILMGLGCILYAKIKKF